MRVAELLASKGAVVTTVKHDASIREALSLLAEAGVGALVVSDDGARIDGILSERDIVREMHVAGARIFDKSVGEIMSTDVHYCGLETLVETLGELMTELRIRHVPVVENGQLCGIISIGDVVKWKIALLQIDRTLLLEYVGAR
jgi:CBS domain-containing protein